jgi:uncharacterized protein (UPF0332 family)
MRPKTSFKKVATLEPDHFFDQAERLIAAVPGAPRQVDLRRAISAAYYGIFHALIAAASDLIVDAANRQSPLYGLVYRSIEHRALRMLCEDIGKSQLPAKYSPYVPVAGFGSDIVAVSEALVDLQKRRHAADYDPTIRIRKSDAAFAVDRARTARARLTAADPELRATFLTLLVFPPRSQ